MVEYGRDNRNDSDLFPAAEKLIPAKDTWNLKDDLGGKIRGGRATLSWRYENYGEFEDPQMQELVFHIRGTNPGETEAAAYIGTSPWFIQGIAKQESGTQNGRTYLQFNEGTPGPNMSDPGRAPNWGYPHGWGMMQIEDANATMSPEKLWNWKANVDKGKEILEEKRKDSEEFWNRQVDQFIRWNLENEENIKDPPLDSTFNGYTFSYSPSNNEKSYMDAIWIKQYNGAYGGNYISWQNTGPYESNPFWQFNRLNNSGYDYVEAVCNKLP
jgi:hypothetical protein